MTALSPQAIARKRRRILNPVRRRPPDRVQEHIKMLLAAGIAAPVIAQAAGIDTSTVNRLQGSREFVTDAIERAVLSVRVTPALISAGRLVPIAGARRRIEALHAMGWHQGHIAEAAGVYPKQVSKILQEEHGLLAKKTHERICEAYERLGGTRGPSQRAINMATRRGYALPAAWDDDQLDMPDGKPSNPEVDRTTEAAYRLDEFERLVEHGVQIERALATLGVARKTLEQAAWRAGRMETGRLLARKDEGAS